MSHLYLYSYGCHICKEVRPEDEMKQEKNPDGRPPVLWFCRDLKACGESQRRLKQGEGRRKL